MHVKITRYQRETLPQEHTHTNKKGGEETKGKKAGKQSHPLRNKHQQTCQELLRGKKYLVSIVMSLRCMVQKEETRTSWRRGVTVLASCEGLLNAFFHGLSFRE